MHTIDPTEQTIEDCIMFLAGEGNFLFNNDVAIDKFDHSIVHSLGTQLGNNSPFTQKQSLIGLRLVKKYSSNYVNKDLMLIKF